MKCPKCGGKVATKDSRETKGTPLYEFDYRLRRNQCTECGNRFVTIELCREVLNDILSALTPNNVKCDVHSEDVIIDTPVDDTEHTSHLSKEVHKSHKRGKRTWFDDHSSEKDIQEASEYISNHIKADCIRHFHVDARTFSRAMLKYNFTPMPKELYYKYHCLGDENICLFCKKCTDGRKCSWVKSFTPVPGWTATQTKVGCTVVDGTKSVIKSYHITACPQFEPDAIPTYKPGTNFAEIIQDMRTGDV